MTGCSHNNIFIRWFLNYTVLLPNNIMIEHHQSLLHAVEVSQIHTRPLLTATLSLLLALYKLDLDRSGGTILTKEILNVSRDACRWAPGSCQPIRNQYLLCQQPIRN